MINWEYGDTEECCRLVTRVSGQVMLLIETEIEMGKLIVCSVVMGR